MAGFVVRCARIILWWHENIGFELESSELPSEFNKEYRALVQTLGKELESNPNAARKVAQIQLDGQLAQFYHHTVPEGMIAEAGIRELAHRETPVRLFELANMILQAEENGEPVFELPQGWEEQSISMKPHSKRVRNVRERGFAKVVADEFTEFFDGLRQRGLGGRDVMIAAHQSAYRHCVARQGNDESEPSIKVFSPASFNFQLATGAGRLVTAMLKDRVHLKQVVVGVQSDWATRTEKEQ